MKDLTLTKTIELSASLADVWNALTEPEKLKKTMFGCDVVTDWRVGSPILFKGSWEGNAFTDKGTILAYQEGKMYQYDYWSNFSGLPDIPENYSIITFTIEEHHNGTLLTLEQRNFATETAYEHSDTNWDVALNTLKELVESP